MDVRLDGKIILVTGSTQGLGESIARLAASSGAEGIVLTGRNIERGQILRDQLASSSSTKIELVVADLAESEGPRHLLAAAMRSFGRIDMLVNCAGLTDRASILDGTLSDWESLFAVNARAPFFLMQGVIQQLLDRGAHGAIVNILSMNAHCGTPDLAIYSATKGAMSTLTRNAANALLPNRIRVNGINMGWAATDNEKVMQSKALGKGEAWETDAAAHLPLKRLLTPAEVAQLAIYMLSEMSGLMTGVLIDLEQSVTGAPSGTMTF